MMITLTNEIKEKIIEETNKERYDNIENIKPYEPFLYIGKFNTLTPKKMSRNKDGELVVTVNQEPINNKNYALILEKREDSKIYDVETGICVSIANDAFELPLRSNDGKDLMTGDIDLIFVDLNKVSKITDSIKKVFDKLQSDEIDPRTLKGISKNVKTNFDLKIKSFIANQFCGTKVEKKYLVQGINDFPLCKETPKIGECFGYVGPIRLLCANKVELVQTENGVDGRFGFCPAILSKELQYPLFFYLISEDKVMEVRTGVIFQFQGKYSEGVKYDDLSSAPLLIGSYGLISPTDAFKLEYARDVANKNQFIESMQDLYKQCKNLFKMNIDMALEEFYFNPKDAECLARVDNDVFNIIHNKEKKLK